MSLHRHLVLPCDPAVRHRRIIGICSFPGAFICHINQGVEAAFALRVFHSFPAAGGIDFLDKINVIGNPLLHVCFNLRQIHRCFHIRPFLGLLLKTPADRVPADIPLLRGFIIHSCPLHIREGIVRRVLQKRNGRSLGPVEGLLFGPDIAYRTVLQTIGPDKVDIVCFFLIFQLAVLIRIDKTTCLIVLAKTVTVGLLIQGNDHLFVYGRQAVYADLHV